MRENPKPLLPTLVRLPWPKVYQKRSRENNQSAPAKARLIRDRQIDPADAKHGLKRDLRHSTVATQIVVKHNLLGPMGARDGFDLLALIKAMLDHKRTALV